MVKTYEENICLEDYIALISLSDLIFTSSTGPLHIGAALGIKTVSLFCPIKVCTEVRWGPHSKGNNFVFVPDNVPQCEKCIKEKCEFFDCMDKIETDKVSTKIIENLNIK
jgi:ADP-heptose:LPS heptosyltransferase